MKYIKYCCVCIRYIVARVWINCFPNPLPPLHPTAPPLHPLLGRRPLLTLVSLLCYGSGHNINCNVNTQEIYGTRKTCNLSTHCINLSTIQRPTVAGDKSKTERV